MKLFLAIIPLFFLMHQLNGQNRAMNHLFKDQPKDLKVFINPTVQFSEITQSYSIIPGMRAGVIINKKFAIGAVYNYTLTDLDIPAAQGGGKLRMQWGGLHLEYTLWPLQVVHLTIPVSGGIGQAKISQIASGSTAIIVGKPGFGFIEPGLMIEANVWKYAKFGIGGSYSYITNMNYNSITSNDLKGFAAIASLKFAKFDYGRRKPNKKPQYLETKEQKNKKSDQNKQPKKKSDRRKK